MGTESLVEPMPMTDTFASGPSSPLGGSHENPQAAPDVTNTLAELERKLRELEQELASIGRRGEAAGHLPAVTDEPPQEVQGHEETSGRLVDEAFEREGPRSPSAPTQGEAPAPASSAAPSEAQLSGLAELRLFRDRLERFARELAEDYEQVLERVMGDFAAGPATVPSIDDTLFEGRVELGVGPFYDIGSLSTFERQVASVPHANDVAVRRFEASHAVIDLSLSLPVALVRELRTRLDAPFSVREVADARLMLTFDDI